VSRTVTLEDPQTGSLVHLRVAELNQLCRRCGQDMAETWICAVEGGVGWVHLEHLERELLALEMTPAFAASRDAREQVSGLAAGDRFVMTEEVLQALVSR
jgi:hypothetical protein